MRRSLFLAVVFSVSLPAHARSIPPGHAIPIAFEANSGQADAQARFIARTAAYSVFLTSDGAVITRGAEAVRMSFRGSRGPARIAGLDPYPGRVNYLVGGDPTRWRTGIAAYAKVQYEELYPGIDAIFYGNNRQIEYDLILRPGADPGRVRLALEGALDLGVTPGGDLVARTRLGEVRLRRPRVYQSVDGGHTRRIGGRYRIRRDRTVGFELAAYDRRKPLVIDPVILYSTYLGGTGSERASGIPGTQMIAVDATGHAYVAGSTDTSDFPTTAGALKPVPTISASATSDGRVPCTESAPFPSGAGGQAVVAKLSPDGSSLVYATYLGGTFTVADGMCGAPQDSAAGIAVDAAGNAYVTGWAGSEDFPVVPASGGFSLHPNSVFVTKLDPSGSQIVYSGRVASGTSAGIAVGPDGSAYVTGSTINFLMFLFGNPPTGPIPMATAGAFQTTCHGCFSSSLTDAFVLRLGPSGTFAGPVYGTYLGGAGAEAGTAIAVDAAGQAYVTGLTRSSNLPPSEADPSPNFPVTAGVFQPAPPLSISLIADVFVAKLSADGRTLAYSTYLAGNDTEAPGGIAVDAVGNAFVTGTTRSADFPTTPGAFLPVLPATPPSTTQAFVTKLSADGAGAYSTFLGAPNATTTGIAVAVDPAGRAHVAGGTDAPAFPLVDATQASLGGGGGGHDAFLSVLDEAGASLVFSTFLGGPAFDLAHGVGLAPDGSAFVAGDSTFHSGGLFPTTTGVFQPQFGGGGQDLFVARLAVGPPPDTTAPQIGPASDVTAEATSAAGAAVAFAIPPVTDDRDPNPTVSAAPPPGSTFPLGATLVTVTATDSAGNVGTRTFVVTVQDTTAPSVATSGDRTVEATTPSGAAVAFTATATDLVDGTITPACVPPPGSTFVVGSTVVTCSAADSHGNTGTATLTVTVLSAEQVIAALVSQVAGADFQQAVNLLNNVLARLAASNLTAACNQLGAFVNMVEARAGTTFTTAEAAALIGSANAARGALGCP